MDGVNRKYLNGAARIRRRDQLCVFISHQKRDTEDCKIIAEYLKSVGIDVYFDEDDQDLRIAVQQDKPKAVVNAIKIGIQNSTHMLCVISPNTLDSKWVPFEVGYGYDITDVFVLTLKGIRSSELPHYVRAVPVIRDIRDLNEFIENKKGRLVLEKRDYSNYRSSTHPLYNVMD